MDMNIWFAAAGGLAVITTLAHVFAGGAVAAKPLLEAGAMNSVARFTNYYCWHIVTIVLAGMAAGFAYAALTPAGADVALVMTVFAAGFAIWNGAMILAHGLTLRQHPQFVFFVPMTLIALPGFAGG